MRKLLLAILSVVVMVGVVIGLVQVVSAGVKATNIADTPHDVGSAGNPTCFVCHTPHNAQADYLWATDISTSPFAGVRALCYSCHDGGTASIGVYVFSYADSGTVTGATATTLTDSTKAWTVDQYTGYFVYIMGGTGVGQQREIASNTADTLTVTSAWDTNPDATSTYAIGTFYAITNHTTGAFKEGTRIWVSAGEGQESSTMLYGDYNKCLSCHAAHAAVSGSKLNSMATSEQLTKKSPLCANCH